MENATETSLLSPKGTFPATIVKIIDDYSLVINRGEISGIREGQRMLVYNTSDEEIKDPNTGESLGFLELVRGTGTIIFVQDKLSILKSDKKNNKTSRVVDYLVNLSLLYESNKKRERERLIQERLTMPSFSQSFSEPSGKTGKVLVSEIITPELNKLILRELSETLPFENPQIGDSVRPI